MFAVLIITRIERVQRSQVKTWHVSAQAAEAIVEAHVKMYVLTVGGSHDAQGNTLPNVVNVDDAGG